MSLDVVIAIPARLGSTRLPRKPLRDIAGRPMLAWVIERAQASGAAAVVVATDDDDIAAVARTAGAQAVMTDPGHRSGSDRLAEVAERLAWPSDTAVINLQGDEPLAPVSGILAVTELLAAADAPMATLATPVESVAQLFDPHVVKVVRDAAGRALYFSRAPVPWHRDAFATPQGRERLPGGPAAPLRHIGIYAYRAGFLRRFVTLTPGLLEQAESLEQLRALEHGHAIAVGIAPEPFPAGVDTEEDVQRVDRLLRRR